MSVSDFHWYIIRCLSGKETKVKEGIIHDTTLAGCNHKVNKIIIPTESVVSMRKGVKYTREKKLFPGYILLHMKYDDEAGSVIRNVSSCGGFVFVKKGVAPIPLRQEEVDKIMNRLSGEVDSNKDAGMHYVVGDNVRITDGPFHNFDGVVQEVSKDKKKLKILVGVFGRKTPVEVNSSQVNRIVNTK